MKEYFRLQYKMIGRRFSDAGIYPLFAYLFLALGFPAFSSFLFHKTEFARYIYLLLALSLIGKLSESGRIEFLRICFGDSKLKKIRFAENLICALPFLLFLLFKQNFLSASILFMLSGLLALASFQTTLNFTLWTPFSKRPFEFSTGFRNTFYLFLSAYLLTAIAVSVNNFNLGVFAMLLVFGTTLSFYTQPENEYYVWIFAQKPAVFLLKKIQTAILFSSALAFPIFTALYIYNNHNIFLLGIVTISAWAFVACVVVAKYSAYPDEINFLQGVLLVLCLWFPPLLLILIPHLFIKAEKRLSPLLK